MPTPSDREGTQTRKSLRWLDQTENWKASVVTSRLEDDFRERTQWQLGKTRDPLVWIDLRRLAHYLFAVAAISSEWWGTGVWRRTPQRVPGAEPLVRESGGHSLSEAEKKLNFDNTKPL